MVLLLLQRLVPGLHMPPQAADVPPWTQTLGHATPFHVPVASQVSSAIASIRIEQAATLRLGRDHSVDRPESSQGELQ